MTKNEKDALINYMDGQLMALCQALKPHMDPDAVGTLYEVAYGVLHDLQDTIIPTEERSYQALGKRTRK